MRTRSSGRLAFESHWADLRLPEPRPDAPYPVTQAQIELYRNLTLLPYYLLLLPYAVYWSLQWLLTPGYPGWTYPFMLRTQRGKLYSRMHSWYLQPLEREEDRWRKSTSVSDDCRALYQGAVNRGEVEMETIKLYPVPKEMQVGPARGDWVKGSIVPGCWLSPRGSKGKGDEKAKSGEQVILHIHGGGYISGHPYWNNLTLTIGKRTQVRILSVNYRKPLVPDQAFPAPLLDVLSGYLHLTEDLGFPASSITILCKSAGGHLALMLSRYLSDLGLPHPAAFCSMAPWCDFRLESPSYTYNLKFDFLSRDNLLLAASAATRFFKPEAMDEIYFNPVMATPVDWLYLKEAGVKVYMMVGTKELFEHEVRTVAETMEAAGVNVMFREDVNGLHTSPLWTPGPMKVFADDVAEVMGVA